MQKRLNRMAATKFLHDVVVVAAAAAVCFVADKHGIMRRTQRTYRQPAHTLTARGGAAVVAVALLPSAA